MSCFSCFKKNEFEHVESDEEYKLSESNMESDMSLIDLNPEEEGEADAAKVFAALEELDIDNKASAAGLVKKVVKKPVLNPDILRQVITLLICRRDAESIDTFPHDDHKISNEITKFMLSGHECFDIGKEYLQRFNYAEVIIGHDSLQAYVRGPHGTIDIFTFNYTTPRLTELVSIFERTYFTLRVDKYPESVEGRRAFARLMKRDIRVLKFNDSYYSSFQIPNDYIRFWKAECNFEKVVYIFQPTMKPTVSDILAMSSQKHKLRLDSETFLHQLRELDEKFFFPSVRYLHLDGSLRMGFTYDKEFDGFLVTIDAVNSLLGEILSRFPKLKKINLKLGQDDDSFEAFETTMIGLHPGLFNYIPKDIKGKIVCDIIDSKTKVKDARKLAGHNAGIAIREGPDGYKILIKEFEIHHGLTFKFYITFIGCEFRSIWSDDDDDDFGEDDDHDQNGEDGYDGEDNDDESEGGQQDEEDGAEESESNESIDGDLDEH